jgi:hypothetical protein
MTTDRLLALIRAVCGEEGEGQRRDAIALFERIPREDVLANVEAAQGAGFSTEVAIATLLAICATVAALERDELIGGL